MKRFIKAISIIISLIMILSTSMIELSAINMDDGTYEVQIALWHSEDDKESMAAASIDPTATIVVENGKAVMHIKCTTMKMMGFTGYVKELNIEDGNGGYVPATVESKDSNGRPTGYFFDLPHTNEYISATMNAGVSIMPMDVSARIKVDYSTLKPVEASESESVTETTTSPKVTTTTPETTTEEQIVQTTESTTVLETESSTEISENTTEASESVSQTDPDTSSGATLENEGKTEKIVKTVIIAVIVIAILGAGVGVIIFIKKRNEEE